MAQKFEQILKYINLTFPGACRYFSNKCSRN